MFRRCVGDTPDASFDLRVPHFLTILAGGFAVPMLLTWFQAYAKLDVPRWWRRIRAERGWVVACLGLGLAGVGAYYTLGRLVVDRWNYSDEITLFESDGPLYVRFMSDTATAEYPVTHRHPLYVLLARGLFWITRIFVGPACPATRQRPVRRSRPGAGIGVLPCRDRGRTGRRCCWRRRWGLRPRTWFSARFPRHIRCRRPASSCCTGCWRDTRAARYVSGTKLRRRFSPSAPRPRTCSPRRSAFLPHAHAARGAGHWCAGPRPR